MAKSLLIFIFLCLLSLSVFAGNSNPKGNRLLLVTYWGDDRVALIDTKGEPGKEEIWSLDTLKAVGCAKPYDIRSNKRGDEAYASCSGTDQVAIIDIIAQQVKYTVNTGMSPRDLVLFDNDKRLMVANSGSDTVSVIDLENRKKLYDFEVSAQPYGVAVSKDGKNALVTGWASGDVHFVELDQNSAKVTGKADVGMLPYTVILPGDGLTGYVAANGSHTVVAIDMKQKKVVEKVQVGRNPWSLAASPDGNNIIVTNNRSNNLSLLKTGVAPMAFNDTEKQRFIAAGEQHQPDGVTIKRAAKNASFSGDNVTTAFTDLANNQVCIVDIKTGEIIRVINVGKAPYGIEYIPSKL